MKRLRASELRLGCLPVPNDHGGYQIILVGKLREKLGYNQAKEYSCGPPPQHFNQKIKNPERIYLSG
ncbi:MAG: hypothetical protein O4805_14200 [Trichodesmium sp. St16_bin2-tuft]|nr:hypothetical protein [Trichodesmium sp. St16_bin2-tuft]